MKTFVYVDGFNLYYGSLKGTPFKWLNLETLCGLLLPGHEIAKIRYFTAVVAARPSDPQAPQRQQAYLRALETLPCVSVHLGSFLPKKKHRPLVNGGGYVWVHDTEEKGSDVNLATYLVHDAHKGEFEQAVVISNDSDLALPIAIVRNELGYPVGLLNPHPKVAFGLQNLATFYKPIRKGVLQASQLPPDLKDSVGTFSKPAAW